MKEYFSKAELLPCIVQSEKDGEVLMLGYMNEAALSKTLNTGFVTFYSRSRKELWTKGETSGNKIELTSLFHDCDKDTFLAKGIEWGPVCHTNVRSCFQAGQIYSKRKEKKASSEILTQLFQRIEIRKENPVEGSYTNYLLEKGVDKICKKIGEESAEVIIAAKTENNDKELLNETVDLIYHLFVLLSKKKLKLSMLFQVFEERFRIEGNLKPINKEKKGPC